MNIGDKINLNNLFTDEMKEYEFIKIDINGNYIFKSGCTTQVLTKEYLKLKGFIINTKKVKYMNFIEAIKLVKKNANLRIKREGNANVCYSSWYRKLYVEDRKNIFDLELFIPTVGDILAEDWYVVKDEKLHSFEEALKAYKSGKSIQRKDFPILELEDHFSLDKEELMANDWIIIDKED